MNNTLLIDLDDTLLINPLISFMPAYINLLSTAMAAFVSPEKMIPQLLFATDRMIANNSPLQTLEDVFDDNFYPHLGLKKADVSARINAFYLNEFNDLRNVTSPQSEASKFIEEAIFRNDTLVVATNPLFPLSAMQARLNWAGFQDLESTFQFITSYENMHFAKPNPAYYAEILGLLGWPQTPVYMLGNSLKEDIQPSSSIGIPGFWVNGETSRLPESVHPHSKAGLINEIIPWLSSHNKRPYAVSLEQPAAVLTVLRATCAVLKSFTNQISDADWIFKPGTDQLSILELISHLSDVEIEINKPRIQTILSKNNPFVAGINSDLWITERNYQETKSKEVLDVMIKQRILLLDILSALSQAEWLRPARHSFFGPTTLLEMMRFIALHDIDHIRQIHKILKTMEIPGY